MNNSNLEVSGATLAAIDLFSDLSLDERNDIALSCRGQQYQANELILSHKETTNDVFFIVSGTVRVTIYSNLGKEITFRDVLAGQMFGELSAIDGEPRSAHVIANTVATIVFITPGNFWRLLSTYPVIAQRTLKYLTRLIRLLSDRVIEFSALDVKNRIHAELLR
ncbi:MAG: CRP/FNR family cyclic AMP-dependent transcriptional regulator, partial [Gammaproteobacteria bacterium]